MTPIARHYGPHYLILKGTVRGRCTSTNGDSFDPASLPVGTLANYGHLLAKYTDGELGALLEVACGDAPAVRVFGQADTHLLSVYKEVQIHGRVSLGEDVEAVVVQESMAPLGSPERAAARAFSEKFGCSLVIVKG